MRNCLNCNYLGVKQVEEGHLEMVCEGDDKWEMFKRCDKWVARKHDDLEEVIENAGNVELGG